MLRVLLPLTATIVTANFLIGIFVPTGAFLEDEISFLDTLWRVVSGQRVGIDYHNSIGVGPYELGAHLWHWLGPHYYVMRLAIALFDLSIAFCGCIVAQRTLARRPELALLFCVTLAFQLSAPTMYESSPTAFSMAGYYNRQIVSALAVLFLQTFGGTLRFTARDNVVEIAVATFLLNALFLIKISGLVVGLLIVLAGCLLRGAAMQRVANLCATLIAFAGITCVEFLLAGIELPAVVGEYHDVAQARLSFSFLDLARGMLSWTIVCPVALLAFFATVRRFSEPRPALWPVVFNIGTYAACQTALNLTNVGESMSLAPAAAACLAVGVGEKPAADQPGDSNRWWKQFAPSRLAEMSVRDAIPLLIFLRVLVPEVVGSLAGAAVASLVLLGFVKPYVVTAGRGIDISTLQVLHSGPVEYETSVNAAVSAISSLDLSRYSIANLDTRNPFPVLFLAPPPKGVNVWWEWGVNVTAGASLPWQSVIGDACVVTMPIKPNSPEIATWLFELVRPKLAADFEVVHQDDRWRIYRRNRGCADVTRNFSEMRSLARAK